MATMRATGAWYDQVKFLGVLVGGPAIKFRAISAPGSVQYDGQAVDNDIQETANHQAIQKNNYAKGQRVTSNRCNDGKIQVD